jgi:hypothetical protein
VAALDCLAALLATLIARRALPMAALRVVRLFLCFGSFAAAVGLALLCVLLLFAAKTPSFKQSFQNKIKSSKFKTKFKIKKADFEACPRWTARELFFWRLAARALLTSFKTDAASDEAFARLAASKAHGALSRGLALFLKTRVAPWLEQQQQQQQEAGGAAEGGAAAAAAALARLHKAERILSRGAAAVLAG